MREELWCSKGGRFLFLWLEWKLLDVAIGLLDESGAAGDVVGGSELLL